MAEAKSTAVKPPSSGSHNKAIQPPRQLKEEETFQNITAWEVHLKNFYRKDEVFYFCVNSKLRWDSTQDNYNLNKEHDDSKLKRDAEELSQDLVSFLQIMAGYVPGDHLRLTIEKDTKCFADIIKIIREFYDAEVGVESGLDFMKIERKPQEPHRMFYERLSAHVREHLVGPDKTWGSISSGEKGDTMTLSMQNLIVMIFLHKINPKLADIVKKEYGPVLKTGKMLCELLPDICRNIDNLLERERNNGAINLVQEGAGAARQICSELPDLSNMSLEEIEEKENEAMNTVQRMYGDAKKKSSYNNRRGGGGYSRDRQHRGQGRDHRNQGGRSSCHHCEYANRAHNLALDTGHPPFKCPNKKAVARMIVAEDEDEDRDDYYGDEGENKHPRNLLIRNVQITDTRERRVPVLPDEYEDSPIIPFIREVKYSQLYDIAELNQSEIKDLERRVQRVVRRSKIRKEKSPAIEAVVRGMKFIITVDEGAELNVISAELVKRSGIPITNTREGANAADGGGLKVVGQTLFQLVVYGYFRGTRVEINLGHTLVVENLEADLLMGEPGKKDNKLWTMAHEGKIYIEREGRQYSTPYYRAGGGRENYSAVKLIKSESVQPGEFINIKLPEDMRSCKEVLVTPRRGDDGWFKPMLRRVTNGKVTLKNITDETVTVRRGRVFGEVRSCREARISDITGTAQANTKERRDRETKMLYDVNNARINKLVGDDDDGFRFVNFADTEGKESHLDKIQLDPDNQLSAEWRTKFRKLMETYDGIVDPAPGKYNGKFGEITTKINFATPPPPSDKVYMPNYSKDMMEQLATKMDALVRWGVLVRAESLGVTVEHVQPSMLVPKGDGDGFRFVTDFSRLNTFIGKFPSVNPTIQDAKDAIAKKKFAVHLDLSNYFYQGGMRREDAQYLGVVHPYQGLFVYVCEPQGLKNASEHAYERLAVIFGDLCRQEKMTRHADGLHVLGDTVEELYANLELVLERCKLAGLTLKPSKVIIAPKNSILFGWKLEGSRWLPTEHTLSALATCEAPNTVKKMRSFIGAFKQFSDLVPGYAKLLHPMELVAAGKESREPIEWTEDLTKVFKLAQEATRNLEAVTVPRPDDKLHTYSDYSEEGRAVGGKMVIERKTEAGTELFLAGHYSVILDKFKARWLPCEGEAAGIKAVLNHFKPWIIDNHGVTTHHTDNQPSVQAWKRLKKGAYSTSSRISSFLSDLSQLSVELEYTPGKDMKTSDFASRNAPRCRSPQTCQICKFAAELQVVGDNSSKIRKITVEDVQAGRSILPLSQKGAWTSVQLKDSAHCKLTRLVEIGQSPNVHKTNGEHTKLKQLHGLYVRGDLMIDKDGTVMVKTKNGAYNGYAISIPHGMFPGLVHTLHIRLNHPSKSQLSQLVQRYFYTPGHQRIIGEVSDSCFQCCSLKPLPSVLIKDTTIKVESCGTNFSADVMEREGQKVLLVRESLTAFTWARLIADQKAETLETNLLSMILPFTSAAGATVRTDGATAFQSLAGREDTDLRKNNITLEVGRLNNDNKNPQAENCVKEFEKETLRYCQDLRFLKEIHIANILKMMNSRIRHQGKSSQEMLMRREMMENRNINISDQTLSNLQQENRQQQSKYQEKFQSKSKKRTIEQNLKIGDFVFVRKQLDKHKARELHVIHDEKTVGDTRFLVVRKSNNQLRSKTYLMLQEELIKAPIKNDLHRGETSYISDNVPVRDPEDKARPPKRQAALKASEKFKGQVLRVKDGISTTPVDHLYGALNVQALPSVHRRPQSGTLSFLKRSLVNVPPFHGFETPATDITTGPVNPFISYGEDLYYSSDDEDHSYQDQPVPEIPDIALLESSNEVDLHEFSLDNSVLHSTLRRSAGPSLLSVQPRPSLSGLAETDQSGQSPAPAMILPNSSEANIEVEEPEYPEVFDQAEVTTPGQEEEDEKGLESSTGPSQCFNEAALVTPLARDAIAPSSTTTPSRLTTEDLNVVSLTARGELSKELDLLIQQGITPPQPPPRQVTTPAPARPERKSSRPPSFKGNYADLHRYGRQPKPSL